MFIIIILLGILLISFYFGFTSQNFSYDTNVYIFNTSDLEFKNVNILDTYRESSILNNKIAPGTKGNFSLVINNNTNENLQYSFIFKENNLKPERIIF